MKKILLLALLAFANITQATEFNFTGTVKSVAVLSTGLGYDDSIAVNGITSAGNCAIYGGLVVLRIRPDVKGNRQISLLLAARLGGKVVDVNFSDDPTNQDQAGYCYLRWVRL